MDTALSQFHPLVQTWFRGRFNAPTEAQKQGWPAIARGEHTLIAAPTGSGKTLAAFLTCIDSLVRAALSGELPNRTQVVYVSPLKALSNDIERNLAEPLADIKALAEAKGTPLGDIRMGVRTGDTPPGQRASMAKNPPHILITTPESLYILLTSQSGRRALKGVRTLILDELHAVVGNKRGSHLSLSAERLCALADGPVTRIGLSATQRPIEQVARYLVGTANIAPDGTPACVIVDSGHRRKMDLALELPPAELGPIASHELWDGTLDRVAALVGEHHTTIVFVNTRRLVERVSHQMALRLGEEAVVAHHGSLSQKTRHDAEQRLKTGTVRLCVATSSLELGIDVGAVDLVCQIGSPRSIGLLLQRVGRSGHSLGGLPKGRLFPLTRDELIECMALMRGIQRGNLDRLIMPSWPLDVLAQQVVAECGSRDWDEDELFELARQAYPYRELPREKYDAVIEALSYGVAAREGRRSAYLHRDAVNRKLKGRRGARLAALTSGGAIPDNSDYDVIVEPENTFVGKVNEDFAVESMKGDVFLLGNTPWRIRRIQSGVVRVEDAQGSAPSVPFWLGEAPGRTNELSDEVSDLREEMYQRIESGKAVAWLLKEGFARDAAEQAVAYLVEGMRVIGTVPTKKRIVAERFFDESGGMQLIVHSPYGSRINRAWGMALRKEICRTFDFELQAAATEDGLNFSLGPTLSFSLEDVFKYVPAHKSEKVLTQAILQVPIFGIRWRWAASRALALLRFSGGRKVPPPIQRMRSDDLLAAVFPAQVACQDNAPPGDIEVPDNPLVFETMRDCLTEAMDLQGFKQVLEGIARGEIEVFARDTTQPSVFSHQILNAMPYAFLDDAPLEERRSRAVALRRALPDNARDLGILDSSAIEDAARDAWPLVRDADELHDALLTLGMLPEQDIGKHAGPSGADGWKAWLAKLAKEGRAAQVHYGEGRLAWTAAERVAVVVSAFPDAKFSPALPVPAVGATRPTQDDAFLTLVRGHVECIGPFTIAGLAGALGLRPGDVDIALARMEGEGTVLRGRFTPGQDEEEFCDRRILARIHRATISRLRKEVEPVSPAAFMRFLFRWQHTAPAWQLQGEDGLAEVIEQLQGFEAAAAVWESDVLPLRVQDYTPSLLDDACLSGEVAWGRFSRRVDEADRPVGRTALSRNGPVSLALREDLPWLLKGDASKIEAPPGAAGEVLEYLSRRGASFLPDIIAGTRRLPSEIEDALWQLVANGLVTADGFGALRGLVSGTAKKVRASSRFRREPRRRFPTSRWSVLRTDFPANDSTEARAAQLLHRYGIVFPELLAREPMAPRWRDLLQVYRRAEARGEIRGGRFVSGFIGEQFAQPEAVEKLRLLKKAAPDSRLVLVSACDPLNLVGILTPGARVSATPGNYVLFQDGVPLGSVQGGNIMLPDSLEGLTRASVLEIVNRRLAGSRQR